MKSKKTRIEIRTDISAFLPPSGRLKSKKTRIETDVIIQVGGIPIYVKIQENKD